MNYHTIKEGDVVKQLKSSKNGLNEAEARKRLQKYGGNELKKIRKLNALKILIGQFVSFLIIILIIAAVVLFYIGENIDAVAILVIVVLNSLFGFFQEYKAEKAIEKLKNMLVPKARVLRQGKVKEIDAQEIVPGDILVLSEGDNIMADCRIINSESLQVNEAALTGESVAEDKKTGILKLDVVMADRTNMLYQGTEIVKGKGKAVVVATGMKTEFGKIAGMVQEIKQEKNPLKKKIDNFAKKLGVIAIVLVIIISLLGLVFGFDRLKMFMTAVSLAVSAIPEGLPAVITISLALATRRMLKVKSLIRKLPAAETLGRATFICTDKTGTITEEKMQVKRIYVNGKIFDKFKKNKSTEFLFKVGILCNNARLEQDGGKEYSIGDPTEKALLMAADDYGLDKKKETEKNLRVKEFPFSSDRKMMSISRKTKNGIISYVKGAPEIIVSGCNAEYFDGKIRKINNKRKEEILRDYEEIASQGMRVLGFAYKQIVKAGEIKREQAERNLIFVGFQGMIDPPRPEVKQAIKECEGAGIKVLMITGDSALTAKAVGEEIGLKGKVIGASQLGKMSDSELSKALYETAIFARVSPEDKLRIVTILKQNKEIVAVTGDGVNDTLALKKADIGIAVGRGTDVAKDSSDIVLLDNNFASIVKAIREGRRVYDNIKKFIKYLLSANTNEMILILFVILAFRNPELLPLLPLQILWINLVTDSLPALALSTEEAEEDVMRRKPMQEGILKGAISFIIIAGIISSIISLIAFLMYYQQDLDKARTMAVTTSVLFQMILVFNCKTKQPFFKSKFNKYIVYAVLISTAVHVAAIYTGLGNIFKFTSLNLLDWVIMVGMCLGVFVILELVKLKIKK